MDGQSDWLGAHISVRVGSERTGVVAFDGQIDTTDDMGDGIVRISGAATNGGRFVLVTNSFSAAPSEPLILVEDLG